MTRPTADQLKAWRELCDYDEGEDRGWEATEDGHVFTGDGDRVAKCQPNIAHLATAKQRAAFIAAAREAVPALLDEVERLRYEAQDNREAVIRINESNIELLAENDRLCRENEAMERVLQAIADDGACFAPSSKHMTMALAALDELRKPERDFLEVVKEARQELADKGIKLGGSELLDELRKGRGE